MNSRARASPAAATTPKPQPVLTVYNGNFAVVRETVPLDLQAGENAVAFAGVTASLEPDSVVLRDPGGDLPFQVLEQSYRADTVSQGLLLSLYEGETIDFLVRDQDQREHTITGRIVSLPTREQINLPVQEQLIVELYSK